MSNEDWRELDESYRSALSGALQTARPSVEQAGGDERAAVRRLSEEAESTVIGMVEYCLNARVCLGMDEGFKSFDPEEEHDFVKELREFVEGRAALAQPSPKCATCGGTGMVDDGEITCSQGGIPYENGPVKCVKDCPDCKAQPSPAQAEAERPEVVAYLFVKPDGTLSMDAVRHKPSQPAVAVMTVAQHERIVEALRAERDGAIKLLGQSVWQKIERLTQERDAALANVDALAVQVLKLGGTISFAHHRTAQAGQVPQAWLDVQAERRRQITAEGWTPEHDDLYCAAELPRAAAAYILNGANDEAPAIWPFVAKWWKPRDARSNYVRASALILAEIERLDRAAHGKEVGHE